MADRRQYGEEFQLQGQAAVWRIASELAMRGHVPFFPGLDVGYDLQLKNGLRLQIKSGKLRYQQGVTIRNYGYSFNLRRGAWDGVSKTYGYHKTRRSYADIADFFVLWGIDENRFFIAPTKRKQTTIWFCARNVISTSNNRKMFEKLSLARIAEFEDRWDLLDTSGIEKLVYSAVIDPRLAQKEN